MATINGVNCYKFKNIDEFYYFDNVYMPIHDKGGIIEEITEQEFIEHPNHKYLVELDFDGVKCDTYTSVFVDHMHEHMYKSLFPHR